jgi:hypothetical protein
MEGPTPLIIEYYREPSTQNPTPTPAPGVPIPSTITTSGTGSSPQPTQSPKNSEAAPAPKLVKNSDIKTRLLRPALTSHFQCYFNPPDAVRKYYMDRGETVSLLCSEASLPGSSLMTNEIIDDHTGITERHAYRRQYDDRSDFTFYVDYGRDDGNYNLILFFEEWIRFCVNETSTAPDKTYFYRVRFPEEYQASAIYLDKFERDFNGDYLRYRFLQAYPINISSMPVSYESSQLLKCTVSFTYTRYLVSKGKNSPIEKEPTQKPSTGVPSIDGSVGDFVTPTNTYA